MREYRRQLVIAVLPSAFLLLTSCVNIRSLFPPLEKKERRPPLKSIQKKNTEEPFFFRVLTLPDYDTAKEAYDKTAILGIPFRKVVHEFKDKALAARKAELSELSAGVRAEVQDLELGATSRIINSDEGFSILQKTTNALYERTRKLMEKKKDGDALKLIRRDLQINPRNVETWLALAKMMDEAGDLDQTLAAYQKARELAPEDPVISNKYSKYLVSQYRYEEAEEILKDAEKKSPEDVGVLLNLASLLVYLNKEPDFASRLITRGSRIDPGRAAWYRLSGVIQKRRELGLAPKAKK